MLATQKLIEFHQDLSKGDIVNNVHVYNKLFNILSNIVNKFNLEYNIASKEDVEILLKDNFMARGAQKFLPYYKRKFVKADEVFDYVYVHYEDKETTTTARLYSIKSWMETEQYEKVAIELENIENKIEADSKSLAKIDGVKNQKKKHI